MKISVKSTNLDLTPSLRAYVETKMDDIGKLIEKFDREGAVSLRLELARTTKHHHKGDVFMAEGNLILPGKTLRAVEKSNDIHRAIDVLKHTLHLEIEKYKTRISPKRGKTMK